MTYAYLQIPPPPSKKKKNHLLILFHLTPKKGRKKIEKINFHYLDKEQDWLDSVETRQTQCKHLGHIETYFHTTGQNCNFQKPVKIFDRRNQEQMFCSLVPAGLNVPSWGGDVTGMSKTNQPSLHTPFYSVLVSISVFKALLFHKFSRQLSFLTLCSSRLISALLVLSIIYLFTKVSFSLTMIQSLVVDWALNTNQLTNCFACGSQMPHNSVPLLSSIPPSCVQASNCTVTGLYQCGVTFVTARFTGPAPVPNTAPSQGYISKVLPTSVINLPPWFSASCTSSCRANFSKLIALKFP